MRISSISMPQISTNKMKSNNTPSFGFRPTLKSEIETYPNIREQFAREVYDAIENYPSKLKDIIQDHGYTITIAPSLNTVLIMRGISNPATILYEKSYPKSSMFTEINSKKDGKNIVIADKRPYSDKYAKNIVNFALSTALTESLDLHKQLGTIEVVYKDLKRFNQFNKLDRMSPNERELFANELVDNNGEIKMLELIPDLIAWNYGAGKYGSGLYGVHDPNFTQKLFPETSLYLKKLLGCREL